jgi:hypothetical protein
LIHGTRVLGVQVVDLRPIFRVNKSPYLYQPDDSHWNPRGISLAAGGLADAVRKFDTSHVAAAASEQSR